MNTRRIPVPAIVVLAVFLAGTCKDQGPAPLVPAAVLLQPGGTLIFALGLTHQLTAAVVDQNGDTMSGQTITWSSSNPSVATVSGTGLLQAVANGSAQVTAHSGSLNSVPFDVTVSQEVITLLKMAGDAQTGTAGNPLPVAITVQALDLGGSPIPGATVKFAVTQGGGSVSAPSVVTTAAGLAAVTWTLGTTAGAAQVVTVSADRIQFVQHPTPSNYPDPTPQTFDATALPAGTQGFTTVEAGTYHTCGRTLSGTGSCWGYGGWGQLGNGSTASASVPQPVAGGQTFAASEVGGHHSCGLMASGEISCWGSDAWGELGAGTPGPEICEAPDIGQFPCSRLPLTVAGGLAFTSVSAGWEGNCGLSASGAACWGTNRNGALGIGGDTATLGTCVLGPCSRTPRAVTGGHTFTVIGVGVRHACGLATTGAVYCWGENSTGQLGIGADAAPDVCGSSPCSRRPVAVAGGYTFTRLRVGLFHTCGLATDGTWYCWGSNNYGQLGTGTTGPELCQGTNPCNSVPVAVAAGPSFATLFPGRRHSCGVTSAGVAHCWGENVSGQLGDGSTANSLMPVAVAGGLAFANLSPYVSHTCGVTTGGVAYCWGGNTYGQLGDGTGTDSSVPVSVAGQTATGTAASAIRVRAFRAATPAPDLRPPSP